MTHQTIKRKKKKPKSKQVLCPYCGAEALLREGVFISDRLANIKHLYVCVRYPECDAYVAAHEHTLHPMGRPANAELRRKRRMAHKAFDKLWQRGLFTRAQAYRWLKDLFFMTGDEAHIGMLSASRCDELVCEVNKVFQNHAHVHSMKSWTHTGEELVKMG